jgi:uncharacterized membrane protein YheB (UPF0754 family)
MTIRTIITWVVPPLIGAVIGFITNVVAIRMLFRPLKEYRLFGIRVPFTPGILPRQRAKLAESIGKMVERELLTPEILRERLLKPNVRSAISNAIKDWTEKNASNRENWQILSNFVTDFLKKDEIHEKLVEKGKIFVFQLMDKLNPIQRLMVSAGNYDFTIREQMPEIIDDIIKHLGNLFEDESIGAGSIPKEKIAAFLTEKILVAIDNNIETLLSTINVKRMVQERIDALEMSRVERIILDVMANNFKWIDIFGAILGALIGIVQVLFTKFFY